MRQLYISEVLRAVQKKVPFLIRMTLLCFVLTFLGQCFFRTPYYRAEATFRQGESQYEDASSLQSLLKTIRMYSEESSAKTVMQSRQLLGTVVEEMGLQVMPVKKRRLSGLFFRENPSEFLFRHVQVEEGKAKTFFAQRNGEKVEILDQKKRLIAQGKMGEPLSVFGGRLTLTQCGKGREKFVLLPKREAIGLLRKNCKIKASRLDHAILHVGATHSQRETTIGIVDGVMNAFQQYLQSEHEEMAKAQIHYLQKRREELGGDFDQALSSHVAYLQDALGVDGFLGLSQEVEMLSVPKEQYTARAHQLDLDAKRWKKPDLIASAEHPWKEGWEKSQILSLNHAKWEGAEGLGEEFEGIDLEAAQKLYASYVNDRDKLSSKVAKLAAFREKIEEKEFELSALSQVLDDPSSAKIIEKGAELVYKIENHTSYSDREKIRFQEELSLQKNLLRAQLAKREELDLVELDLIEKKLFALKQTALHQIEKEQEIIQIKLGELKEKMADLPEKWRLESLLKLKKELIMQIIEGLTQLSESKVVSHHLFHIESKPIDSGDAPLKMENPHLFLFSSLGGFLGLFFCTFFFLAKQAMKGFPLSPEFFRDNQIYFAGFLDKEKEDVLKKVVVKIPQKSLVGILGAPFGKRLIDYLEKKGKKVAILTIDDLENHETKSYDYSFVMSEESFDSADAHSFSCFCDRVVLVLNEESEKALTFFDKEKMVCVLKG